jgi:hypothetical protein
MHQRSSHARLMPSRLQRIINNAAPDVSLFCCCIRCFIRLSVLQKDDLVEVNDDKRSAYDFALWKRAKESDVIYWRTFWFCVSYVSESFLRFKHLRLVMVGQVGILNVRQWLVPVKNELRRRRSMQTCAHLLIFSIWTNSRCTLWWC